MRQAAGYFPSYVIMYHCEHSMAIWYDLSLRVTEGCVAISSE